MLNDMAGPARAVTILIADGTPEFRESVRLTLAAEGFQVIEPATNAAARETIQRGEAALVITAVVEGFGGLELVAWAKEWFPALPAILVAQAANPVGIQEGFATLLEPVSSEELLSAVHQLLQSGPPR